MVRRQQSYESKGKKTYLKKYDAVRGGLESSGSRYKPVEGFGNTVMYL
jgi:hypothetical protein